MENMMKMSGLKHLFVTMFIASFGLVLVIPGITDVTMSALCPGRDRCSLAIFLTGLQQVLIGAGTVVMMPLIGKLSDVYGRKALLTVPMTLSIFPLVVLAYSRTTKFFYAYYVLRTVTSMLSDGSIQCLALAYVADNVAEARRATAFGILSGLISAAFVCGTLTAHFLSTAQTFQVAAFMSMVATVYMRIFLKDAPHENSDDLVQPVLKTEENSSLNEGESSSSVQVFKKIPSVGDIICLLKSRVTFSQAAIVVLFNSLAEGGLQSSTMYFFKAQFHYNKDQFADLMLIGGVAGAVSQLLFMPILAPIVGEEKLLSLGLLVGASSMILNSIAWSSWVPYALSVFSIFAVLTNPCLRSIVSRQVGPNEQGMAHGCISAMSSFANILSPFIFSPLTALFLSKGAPFHFPGFSLMCAGIATMIAFIVSLMIRAAPPVPSNASSDSECREAA